MAGVLECWRGWGGVGGSPTRQSRGASGLGGGVLGTADQKSSEAMYEILQECMRRADSGVNAPRPVRANTWS